MSKTKDPNVRDSDLEPEYDFSRGKRGVYFDRAGAGGRAVTASEGEDTRRSPMRETSERDARDPDLLLGDAAADFVALWVTGRHHPEATDYWDGNWLTTPIEIRARGYRGRVLAALRADELVRFRIALEGLEAGSDRVAVLESMEDWLTLRVQLSTLGHLEISGASVDQPGSGNQLQFSVDDMALADVRRLVHALRRIEAAYPVLGQPS